MSRWVDAIDTSQLLCYLSFCSTWRLYFSSPVITVLYLSHEELLSRDARYHKEVTRFEIFYFSRLVNVLLPGTGHTATSRGRRRELHL
jgi:hypothetical protein